MRVAIYARVSTKKQDTEKYLKPSFWVFVHFLLQNWTDFSVFCQNLSSKIMKCLFCEVYQTNV